MIDRFSDIELLEMGVAKFHIDNMHNEEIINKAVEQTKKDFQFISLLLGNNVLRVCVRFCF